MPNKLFKKNAAIALVKSWDDKGTVYIRRGTVHSCGKCILRVQLANGKMLEELLYVKDINTSVYATHVIPDAGRNFLQAYGMQLAERFLAAERQRLDTLFNNSDSLNYKSAMEREIELLHEPRIEWR